MAGAATQERPFKNQEQVCCLSAFFLLWVHPLLRAGWKGEMRSETMVPDVLGKLRCAGKTHQPLSQPLPHIKLTSRYGTGVTEDAKRLWAAERTTTARPEPALWRAMMSLCSRDLIIGTLASSFQGVLSTILRPIVLAMLIQTIQKQRLDQATTAEAVIVVLFFASISFADNMTKVLAFQRVNVAAGMPHCH